MNSLKVLLIAGGATLLALAVHKYWPTIQTRVETKIVNQIHTVTRIVEHPGGLKETIIDSTFNTTKTKDKQVNAPNWHISAAATTDITSWPVVSYKLQMERRILGPFWAGVLLSTRQEVGLVIGVEF